MRHRHQTMNGRSLIATQANAVISPVAHVLGQETPVANYVTKTTGLDAGEAGNRAPFLKTALAAVRQPFREAFHIFHLILYSGLSGGG